MLIRYHIPRTWIKPKDNLLVILEEEKANPKDMEILNVDRDTVCTGISEKHPPHVKAFAVKGQKFHATVEDVQPEATVKCPNRKKIVAVEFASFGNSTGACGNFALGKCNAPETKQIVEQQCLGKESCSLKVDRNQFNKNGDPCPDLLIKTLIFQVKCSF